LINNIQIAKDLSPLQLSNLSIETMLEKQHFKVQHIISDGLHKNSSESLDLSIPQGPAVVGKQMHYAQLKPWDQERVIQHLVNKDIVNSAFLTANPCLPLCGMSNEAFRSAIQHRLLLPIAEDRSFCKCGTPVGHFLSHCYKCSTMSIRNKVRNSMHKKLKNRFEDILKHRIEVANVNVRILKDEPLLEDYYDRATSQSLSNTQDSQHNSRDKVRADMAVKNITDNTMTIIDFTFVEPTSNYVGPYNKVGQAAELRAKEKLKEYSSWNINNNINKLMVFSVETFGVLSKDSKTFFNSYIHESENSAIVMKLVQQQLSVALHCMRAEMFLLLKRDYTSDLPPSIPLTNDNRG
jgi:hypothetical protein